MQSGDFRAPGASTRRFARRVEHAGSPYPGVCLRAQMLAAAFGVGRPAGGGPVAGAQRVLPFHALGHGPTAIGVQFHPDAREDMSAGRFEHNPVTQARPGVHPLALQLELAARRDSSAH